MPVLERIGYMHLIKCSLGESLFEINNGQWTIDNRGCVKTTMLQKMTKLNSGLVN